MVNRIKNIFLSKNKVLTTFITAGDPNLKITQKILEKLSDSGADILEIGMPFSDPMADGPTIQLSSSRAIKNQTGLEDIFLLSKNFRKKNKKKPIILMGYYNPIHYYGNKKFVDKCVSSEIDGIIVVDLQPENDGELSNLCKKNKIEFIRLLTPTTNSNRLKSILKNASGFLYYVSVKGTTGQKTAKIKDLKISIKEIKKKTNLPVLVGFGIKSAEMARKVSKISDGVIVGTSIIKYIENFILKKTTLQKTYKDISRFVSSLSKGMN